MSWIIPNAPTFELPPAGLHHGILADIEDIGLVTSVYQGVAKTQPMARFIWLLDKNGKDGKQLRVTQRFSVSSMHEKSNLYKAVKQILNAAPPSDFDIESLIGTVRGLVVTIDKNKDGKEFANVMGVVPAQNGATVAVAADFVRDKNKQEGQRAKDRQKNKAAQQTANTGNQAAQQPVKQGADVAF